MKKSLLSSFFLMMFLFSIHSFGQNTFTKTDSMAIQKASHDFETAFNAHDAKSFANLFKQEAEFTNVVGATAKGRKAIEEFHAPLFEGKPGFFSFKNSTLRNGNPKICVIKPDVASVDILWTMDRCFLPDGTESINRRGLVTLLMVKENEKWSIAIMHNAELPPSAN